MADEDKKIQLLIDFILSVLSAAITGLLSVDKETWLKVKNCIAGILCGCMLFLWLRNAKMDQFIKDLLCIIGSAFVTQLWPLIRDLVQILIKKYINKKSDDIIRNT